MECAVGRNSDERCELFLRRSSALKAKKLARKGANTVPKSRSLFIIGRYHDERIFNPIFD